MALNFRNILLLSNLGVDMGLPDFRLGTYLGTLLPMAHRLEEGEDISVRVMANEYIARRLQKISKQSGHRLPNLVTFVAPQGLSDFMIRSNTSQLSAAEMDLLRCSLSTLLGDWHPDIILCWESPSHVFRQFYPSCAVLDMMPSMFMRPPYPQMIAFDPCGLYGRSWLATEAQGIAPETAINMVSALRSYFKDHFAELDVPSVFEKLTDGHHLDQAILLPFQISQYFGWSNTSHFSTQTELLESVHAHLPPGNDLVCTQYTGALIEEKILTEANIFQWRRYLPNLVYHPYFDELDNLTQYLTPFARGMVSVSSTLGLQAKFYGKSLISPSFSHLPFIADGDRLEDLTCVTPKDQDNLIALYLARSCLIKDRVLQEPGYFISILQSFFSRRGEEGVQRLPSLEQVGNTVDTVLQYSKTDRSATLFKRFVSAFEIRRQSTVALKGSLLDRPIVSFDVFDTLVCRTVLEPKDVFELMQAHLRQGFREIVPESFIDGFVHLRQAAEKILTQKSAHAVDDGIEEITIAQVYAALAVDFKLSPEVCTQLIDLEQQTELDCLIPRPAGQRLFYQARQRGQRIIILSDFIHDHFFVEKVLRRCGYKDWDALYVSSAIGVKKHSGALFRHAAKDLGVAPEQICHVGDNAYGDFEMARQNGWGAIHLTSTPARVKRFIRDRPLNINAVNNSIYLGGLFSAYARCFLDDPDSEGRQARSDIEMIWSEEQLGFLTIGPAMYYFAKWLLDEAQLNGCHQIMFFARDTTLPYRILKTCFADRLRELGVSVCYLPISRIGAASFNIHDPRDLWSVRIDDFNRARPLTELFEKRFLLQAKEIDTESLEQWTSKPLGEVRVGDLPAYAIYRIAHASVERNWEEFLARRCAERDLFRRGLTQWGCDTDRKTLAVDIGYKGTLTRKVQFFFAQPLVSRFFVSYANALGGDPLKECSAFYLSRQVPQIKDTEPFLKYNLIIETMLNEGVGSVVGYYESNGSIRVRRDPSVNKAHSDAVTRLHTGALIFARVWHETTSQIAQHLRVSPQMLLLVLDEILRRPTVHEARLLAPLVFDNGYSGNQYCRLVQLSESGVVQGGVWKEGMAILRQSHSSHSGLGRSLNRLRLRLPKHVVRYFVKYFSNKRLLKKFDRDPHAFFNDSANPMVRWIGHLLYR